MTVDIAEPLRVEAELVYGTDRTASRYAPSASIPGLPWFCVHTKPQRELHVEHQVRREGAAVWFPMQPVTVRPHRGKPFETHRPIFPRYGFLQMTGERERWGCVIRNAAGEELGAVMRGPTGKPLVVPPSVLETLWKRCAPNGVIYPKAPREVCRDDTVRVTDGPLVDWRGVVKLTSKQRVEVLLGVLGRVSLRREQVELVG